MYNNLINKWLEFKKLNVNLLVVTKNRSIDDIITLYNAGQIHFGENRVNELINKYEKLLNLPIKWHFIGHLQSNKCNELLRVTNLYMIESIDSKRLVMKLIEAMECINYPKLRILIQINTSLKTSQFGINYNEINLIKELVEYVIQSPLLFFNGLMTIGDGNSYCFQRLQQIKKILTDEIDHCHNLDINNEFIMSMGMSNDWKDAINHGATEIRIGSYIFNATPIET